MNPEGGSIQECRWTLLMVNDLVCLTVCLGGDYPLIFLSPRDPGGTTISEILMDTTPPPVQSIIWTKMVLAKLQFLRRSNWKQWIDGGGGGGVMRNWIRNWNCYVHHPTRVISVPTTDVEARKKVLEFEALLNYAYWMKSGGVPILCIFSVGGPIWTKFVH